MSEKCFLAAFQVSFDKMSTTANNNNNNNNCTSSRWLTEEVYGLIQIVQQNEAIYNPRHKYYFCRPYVENFWREVDLKLEKNPGASLAKWTNLRISFRREYTNYLEEKVPPCWSYFDRMFFLHPYLRKKHQQSKSLDSQVQDALVQISTLSSRLQRERATGWLTTTGHNVGATGHHQTGQSGNQQPLDSYLDYFDEPEQLNSELDEIIDDDNDDVEQPARQCFKSDDQLRMNDVVLLHSDVIKSECDDQLDEYADGAVRCNGDLIDEDVDGDQDIDETEMPDFILGSTLSAPAGAATVIPPSSSSIAPLSAAATAATSSSPEKRHHLLQHFSRLRDLVEIRAKRPRSQESISSTHTNHTTANVPLNSSVGFVRPTFQTKQPTSSSAAAQQEQEQQQQQLSASMEIVSTTTNHNMHSFASDSNDLNATNAVASSTTTTTSMSPLAVPSNTTTSASLQQQRHHLSNHHHLQPQHHQSQQQQHYHHHRMEIPTGVGVGIATASGSSSQPHQQQQSKIATNATPHLMDLCDCKTDPDAMFLMSLLPDIQKLNGRDRGKIKIAFQNILQDYLYPD